MVVRSFLIAALHFPVCLWRCTPLNPDLLFLWIVLFAMFCCRVAWRKLTILSSELLRLMWSISPAGHSPWKCSQAARPPCILTPSTQTTHLPSGNGHPALPPTFDLEPLRRLHVKTPVSGSYERTSRMRSAVTLFFNVVTYLKDAAQAVEPVPGLVLIRTVRGLSAAPAV